MAQSRNRARAGTKTSAQFRYPRDMYTPYSLHSTTNLSEEVIRSEYSRLRTIANKRIARMSQHPGSQSAIYKEYSAGFPTIAEIPESRDIKYYLASVARFVRDPMSSVSYVQGAAGREAKRLRNEGIKNATAKNVYVLGLLFEKLKELGLSRVYDSGQVEDLFDHYTRRHVSKEEAIENIVFWLDNPYGLDPEEREYKKMSYTDRDGIKHTKTTGLTAKQWRKMMEARG